MRRIYSLALYLLTPFVLGYLLVRGLADPAWWRRWRERFGRFEAAGREGGIVVHAVSVGEVNAAAPLLRALHRRWPDLTLAVTCFTPTGSARISSLFGGSVFHVYAPFDLPGAARRFLACLRPRLLIVMETEIWPNLYADASRRGIPILLANARMTARSAGRYARFRPLVEKALRRVSFLGAQSEADAQRFIELGVRNEHARVTGNLKFDLEIPADVGRQARALRETWGPGRPVLAAGSTHEGDEIILIDAFRRVLERHPDALLVLAPRYPERFSAAADIAGSRGLRVQRHSESSEAPGDAQCLIADTMGELLGFYAAADVAFIGGTLSTVGGHNPLEAAALGRPLLLGPHTSHIGEPARMLLDAGAALTVTDSESLAATWLELIENPARAGRSGGAGQALVQRERGALDRTVEAAASLLLQ